MKRQWLWQTNNNIFVTKFPINKKVEFSVSEQGANYINLTVLEIIGHGGLSVWFKFTFAGWIN